MSEAPTRVWYLAMEHREALRPARPPGPRVAAVRAEIPTGALNRFFYEEVGRGHSWTNRRGWPLERWQAWAEAIETWLVWERGTPAGYAELVPAGDEVDVASFGLLAGFRGRGLGGHLLEVAVRRAWDRGARRVTLNTCELDGPYALDHYRARGFQVVRERMELRERDP
jgi:GNAT superfamily N-acetyltransferase